MSAPDVTPAPARPRGIFPWALSLLALAYVLATAWVFTRSAPVTGGRPVTIRLAHWQIEAGPPDGIAAVIRRYEATHPLVKVEQVLIPGSVYRQWMRTNLAGDTGPDLIEYGAWLEGVTDIPARHFAPITAEMALPNPYNRGTPLAGVPWVNTFKDELLYQRFSAPEPGQLYAATLSEVSLRLFCNRELLAAIAPGAPPPRTFADFRVLCAQLDAWSQRTGRTVYAAAGSRTNAQWIMEMILRGLALRVSFDVDTDGSLDVLNRETAAAYLDGRWDYRRPELAAGLTLVREVTSRMKPGFLQLTRDDATQQFLRGEALFHFTGTWDGTSLRRAATFPVDVLRFPQPTPDDPVAGPHLVARFADGTGITCMEFYLNKRTPHRAEALDFLRYLTSVGANQLFSDTSGWLPSVRGVEPAPEIRAYATQQDCIAAGPSYYLGMSALSGAFERQLHLLVGPQGGVDKFVAALALSAPAAAREDTLIEVRNCLATARPQDIRLAAAAVLARLAPAADEREKALVQRIRLESSQTQGEGQLLQMELLLRRTEKL